MSKSPAPAPAAARADVLSLDSVSKAFGSKQAVQDVTFSVRAGEVFGFLGPNGAGKSTTIRMILDILRPTAGTITLFGVSNRLVEQTHARLGYLSGDMVMDDNLTGRQYLTFVAAQYGKDCAAGMAQLAEVLQADLSVRIGNYSRGNRQKIGLIAALQHEPELLILDEPTSGFDPLVQEQFAELIEAFTESGGSVFMSSHILSEVQQLCDRVAFIRDGRIIDITTIEGLTASAAKQVCLKAPAAETRSLRKLILRLDDVRMLDPSDDCTLRFSYGGEPRRLLQLLAAYEVQDLTIKEPDLDEIFMHYYADKAPGDGPSSGTAAGKGALQA